MNRALASIGIAAAVICGSAAPALAADNPIDAKITYISSGSSQVSTPAPNPTTTTPVPVPSVSTPAPQSGTGTPSAKPSHSGTATSSTRPTVKAETPKPSETNLAKTGSDSSFLVVLVPMVAIIGTFIYLVSLSRKDDN